MKGFRIAGLDLGKLHDPPAITMLEKPQHDLIKYEAIDPRVKLVALRQWALNLDYTVLADEVLEYGADALVVEVNGPGEPFLDMLRKEARRKGYKGRIHGAATSASNVRPRMRHEEEGKKGRWVSIPKDQLVYSINALLRRNTYVVCDRCGGDLPADKMRCYHVERKLLRHRVTGEEKLVDVQCEGHGVQKGSGLIVPYGMEEGWARLMEQAQTFDQLQSAAGRITFDQGGGGHHGDLVMSCGIACWWLNRFFAEGTRRELAVAFG